MANGGYKSSGRRSTRFAAGQPVCLLTQWNSPQHFDTPGSRKGSIMQIDYPFHIDNRGRTASTDTDDHIRDLIEQVLFTSPGERVNRPDFGCGVMQLVFAPNSEELATATQFTIQGALQQWLGDVIQVEDVRVESDESTLRITIKYIIRRSQQQQIAQFTRAI
jgi:phage baseplate assembly protein W